MTTGSGWRTSSSGTVTRIDPGTNAVAETIETGQRPVGLALDGDRLWVAARDASPAHRGGTLRVAVEDLGPTIDQVDYSLLWNLNLTGDGLTAYRRVAGTDGAELVPDLAVSIPTPADDGRTYTFQLRRGVRYSTGEPVGPGDFRRAVERYYRLGPASAPYYDAIVGAAACRRRPDACDLSRGIVADDAANTVTIHLARPDPNLVHNLALPFAHAVAPSAPPTEVTRRGLPATGPYMVAGYRPGRELRLVRNPRFQEWSRAARPDGYPDEILLTVAHGGVGGAAGHRAGPPRHRPVLPPRAGSARAPCRPLPGSAARGPAALDPRDRAQHDPAAVRSARRPAGGGLRHRPGRARPACSGGPRFARPTCQILPPNFPAYAPYCPFTRDPRGDGLWRGPDIEEARRLVASSGTAGATVVVRSDPAFPREARYVATVLRQLGYRASARLTSNAEVAGGRVRARPRGLAAGVAHGLADRLPRALHVLRAAAVRRLRSRALLRPRDRPADGRGARAPGDRPGGRRRALGRASIASSPTRRPGSGTRPRRT